MGAALRAVADLLLGEVCAGCGRAGGALLCPSCRSRLRPEPFLVQPAAPPPGFPPTTAACPYAGPARRLVIAHKERGRLAVAAPLADLLVAAVADACPRGEVTLVPIPSRAAVTRRRGHDPLARVAAAVARRMGPRARVARVLRHARPVLDQEGLARHERRANLAGALRAVPSAPAPRGLVVVLDDVCSTGATLAAAASALDAVGWGPVRAAVVAAPALRARERTRVEGTDGSTWDGWGD